MNLAARHHEKNEKEKRALANYEMAKKLPKGSATIDQVQATSAGVEGFANWKPTIKDKQPDMLELAASKNFDEDDDEQADLKAEGRDKVLELDGQGAGGDGAGLFDISKKQEQFFDNMQERRKKPVSLTAGDHTLFKDMNTMEKANKANEHKYDDTIKMMVGEE